MSNKLQNVLKYLTLANFSMATYNFVINQTKNKELVKSLELEKERNFKLNNELKDLLNIKNNSTEIDNILENVEISENKINDIKNIAEVINNLNNSEEILSQLENLDNKIKSFNNDLNSIITKVEDYINSENNYLDLNIFKEIYSYIENLSIIQNIAFMNISALIFISLSLISLLSILFGEFLILKFNIKDKYPRIYKFIEIRRKFQRFYIIVDSLIILIMVIILLIANIYLLIYH